MKANVEVEELSHDELVNLLSTATYGNESLRIDVPEESRELYKENAGDNCWEDKLANVLLKGGSLVLVDMESEDEDIPEKTFATSVSKESYCNNFSEFILLEFTINLQSILDAVSTPDGYDYAKELLIDEKGDIFTAYNIMQIVMYKEVIYG